MNAGVVFQVRVPGAAVAFQMEIPFDADTSRSLSSKVLSSLEVFNWSIGPFPRDTIAILAIQSRYEVDVTINGDVTTLYGTSEKDAGIGFVNSGANSFGTLPFSAGDVEVITIENKAERDNPIQIIIASMVSGSGS